MMGEHVGSAMYNDLFPPVRKTPKGSEQVKDL